MGATPIVHDANQEMHLAFWLTLLEFALGRVQQQLANLEGKSTIASRE
jgi:hypothetical protein